MRFKDNTYFIEEVLAHRRDADDKLEVLIHWEGYESSQDSWVRASTVQHTQPYKDYFLKLKTTSKRSSQTSQVATNTSTHVSSTPSRVQPSRKRKMKRMPEPSKGQTKPRAKRARLLDPLNCTVASGKLLLSLVQQRCGCVTRWGQSRIEVE